MRKFFSSKSSNWNLVDLKIYNVKDFIEDKDKKNDRRICLVLFKYYSEDFKKNKEVIFIRDLEKTKCFYDWKILDFNEKDDIDFSLNRNIKT